MGGLMDDTPLGRVVAVRAETNREAIRRFTPWQRRLRAEWKQFLARRAVRQLDEAALRCEMAGLERMLSRAFGGEQ